MGALQTILPDLQARLQEKVPQLACIDKDWGQLAAQEPAVEYPCALLDLKEADFTQTGGGGQMADVRVTVTLGCLRPSPSLPQPAAQTPQTLDAAQAQEAPLAQQTQQTQEAPQTQQAQETPQTKTPQAQGAQLTQQAQEAPQAQEALQTKTPQAQGAQLTQQEAQTPQAAYGHLGLLEGIHAALHAFTAGDYAPLCRTRVRKTLADGSRECYEMTYQTACTIPHDAGGSPTKIETISLELH